MNAKFLAGLLGRALAALPIAGCFASCELVREDLPECYQPTVQVRFVYEYNLEFANAFHKQVDCLSVYFFDSEGQLAAVEKVTEPALLADENYRMHPVLTDGSYRVVAYGGMECENASFSNTNMTKGSQLEDLHVHLNPACLVNDDKRRLHNHYYGAADFTVDSKKDTYVTVEMMRNTNSIQIALQHMNGQPVDCNDFEFEIIDDNNDFDHENNLLATGEITYKPWNTENRPVGQFPDTEQYANDPARQSRDWQVALAQFTTSRLVKRTAQNGKLTSTTLRVRSVKDGKEIIEAPLVNYMLLFKTDNTAAGFRYMGDQEYLDRANSWNFVFFLDEGNLWVKSIIKVNDWEVRFGNPNF